MAMATQRLGADIASLMRNLRPRMRPLGRCAAYSTVQTSRQDGRQFRLAVVGSGPAGFYSAYRVMSRLPTAKIDMYEALPVPFGLVRFGVAPDHPEVKNCQEKFEEVAASPNFTFIGNVSIGGSSASSDGQAVGLASLIRSYDAVLFAYGAARDKNLGVPGELTLDGIYSAREFVGWYNGLPECAHLAPELTRGDEAVIVGQGNVALDVARMLLEDVDNLRKTDIAEHALDVLSRSRVRRVHVIGRRGPLQAAFTIKEARELMKLPAVAFHPADSSLIPSDLKYLPRASRRLMEVLVKGSQTAPGSAHRSWSLDFCLSPTAFKPDTLPSHVGSTLLQRTELSSKFDPASPSRPTGESIAIPSKLVFRSIGYKSSPLPGFDKAGILFDERKGVIMNDGLGRVLRGGAIGSQDGDIVPEIYRGLYCAGWVKRGPTGVIATTMQDAFETADSIIQDWLSGTQMLSESNAQQAPGWEGIRTSTRQAAKVVHWQDWKKIDSHERAQGRIAGKEREKLTSISDMLRLLP